jgi:transcriptional regulator with XRE-family HTH domain
MRTAEKIQNWVKKRGLTQDAFERMVGLPQGRISKWLNGPGEPTGKQIFRIARALDLSMDYLLDEAVTEPAPSANLNDAERTLIKIVRIMDGGAVEAIRRITGEPARVDAPVGYGEPLRPAAATKRKLPEHPVGVDNRPVKAGKNNR